MFCTSPRAIGGELLLSAGRSLYSPSRRLSLLPISLTASSSQRQRPPQQRLSTMASDRPVTVSGPPSDPRPVVVSGPSGVGKTTIVEKLIEWYPDYFTRSVSYTTRLPRDKKPGELEEQDVDYHFLEGETAEERIKKFEDLIAQDAFLEYAKYGGGKPKDGTAKAKPPTYYGTPKDNIAQATSKGKVTFLVIERVGVEQLQAKGTPARFVFVQAPTFEILEARLRGRTDDSKKSEKEKEDDIQSRLNVANDEIKWAETAKINFRLLNEPGKVKEAAAELMDFIYGEKLERTG